MREKMPNGLQKDISEICDVLNKNPIDNIITLRTMIDEYIEIRKKLE